MSLTIKKGCTVVIFHVKFSIIQANRLVSSKAHNRTKIFNSLHIWLPYNKSTRGLVTLRKKNILQERSTVHRFTS